MRIACQDYQGTALPLLRSLLAVGHTVQPEAPTDLFLIDLDPDDAIFYFGYRDTIDFYSDLGATVLLYPHGAGGPMVYYDGLYEPYDRVDGQLVISPADVEMLRLLDVDRPTLVIGWYFCRQLPFRASTQVRRVTFAPTHPNADGSIKARNLESNARIFRRLLECDFPELVVRYLGALEENGLWHDPRVFRWIEGKRDMTTVEIDSSDVVVAAEGSYPRLAVARGAPLVIYDQLQPQNYSVKGEAEAPLSKLALYRDLVRYPFDAEEGDLHDLICTAARSEAPIAAWRASWIGEPFEPISFPQRLSDFMVRLNSRTLSH